MANTTVKCPKCGIQTSQFHCKSRTCSWRVCGRCSLNIFEFIVFDRKLRYFTGKRD